MKKKILLSIVVLILMCFSLVGFGCDTRTRRLIVKAEALVPNPGGGLVQSSGPVEITEECLIKELSFDRIRGFDINGDGTVASKQYEDSVLKTKDDDLNDDGVVDSTDLKMKKEELLKDIDWSIAVVTEGDVIVNENDKRLIWTSYSAFTADGGYVSGFDLDRDPGTYYFEFKYNQYSTCPIAYVIK